MKSIELPDASETTIPLNPVASPSKVSVVKIPQPAGTVEPVKEKPKTVVADEETVNPAAAASPPLAPVTDAPSTVN